MKTKQLVKGFNYGEREHKVYYDIVARYKGSRTECDVDNITRNLYENIITPYMIKVNRSRELADYLIKHYYRLDRFCSFETDEIELNDLTYLEVKYFSLSKAFLSYIIQNKDNIKELFDEKIIKDKSVYHILEIDILDNKGFIDKMSNVQEPFLEKGVYNLKLLKYINRIIEFDNKDYYTVNKRVVVDKRKCYIDDKEYRLFISPDKKRGRIFETQTKIVNHYDKFKRLLEEFFQNVNTHNDADWDEYISREALRMLKYMDDSEVEKIRNEYNN